MHSSSPEPYPPVPAALAIKEWDAHLAQQRQEAPRSYTFDMDDAPERALLLDRFPKLAGAIGIIERELLPRYERANSEAISLQKIHGRLAKVAILSGGLAIGLAILQLAPKHSAPSLATVAAWIEGAAALGGLVVVVAGIWAMFNHQWFIQRHVAERLRMLKFQLLGQREYWCGATEEWRGWLQQRI